MPDNISASDDGASKSERPGLEKLVYADAALDVPETIKVESVAFEDNQPIPPIFTADGEKDSPPLRWRHVPDGAAAVVLVVEDADSPTPAPLVHALAIKAPGRDDDLIPGALSREEAADEEGLRLGRNSFMRASWLPPDPPAGHGPHRYVFQIYAVDRLPEISGHPGKQDLLDILRGHTLAKGRVTGIYERPA